MAPRIKRLREHLAAKDDVFPDGHTLNEEIRVYHETLDRAFSIADSGAAIPAGQSTARGRRVCAEARRILLDDVVFRYNYLVGQLKKKDTLSGMVAVAQTNFARWLLSGDTSSDTAIVAADRFERSGTSACSSRCARRSRRIAPCWPSAGEAAASCGCRSSMD